MYSHPCFFCHYPGRPPLFAAAPFGKGNEENPQSQGTKAYVCVRSTATAIGKTRDPSGYIYRGRRVATPRAKAVRHPMNSLTLEEHRNSSLNTGSSRAEQNLHSRLLAPVPRFALRHELIFLFGKGGAPGAYPPYTPPMPFRIPSFPFIFPLGARF